MVTPRPGTSQVLGAVVLVGALCLIVWFQGRAQGRSADWDSGVPVLVVVTGHVDDSLATVTEYQSTRRWTAERRVLNRVASDGIGTRIQARLVGDCRCQLMLARPRSFPLVLIALVVAGLVATLPGVMAWRRWRFRRQVLALAPQPVRVVPIWLNRTIRPAAWAVRIAPTAGRGALYLEMAGTPLTWMPDGARLPGLGGAKASDGVEMDLYGPHPGNGLCVLAAPAGLAVASAPPRTGDSAVRAIPAWADRLSLEAGLVDLPPEKPVAVGGTGHSRISLTGGPGTADARPGGGENGVGGPAGATRHLAYGPSRVAIARATAVVLAYAVTAVVARAVVDDPLTMLVWLMGAGMVAGAGARVLVMRLMAIVPPLSAWPDRRADRDAAAAATGAGLVAISRAESAKAMARLNSAAGNSR